MIRAAKQKRTLPYKTLMKRYKIPRGTRNGLGIGWLIGYISEYEYEHGRPLLSAIVVKSGSKTKLCPKGHPGPGFMRVDAVPYNLKRRSANDTKPLKANEQKFIHKMQQAVWKCWARRTFPKRSLNDFLNK